MPAAAGTLEGFHLDWGSNHYQLQQENSEHDSEQASVRVIGPACASQVLLATYVTVTDFARLRGLSGSKPLATAR